MDQRLINRLDAALNESQVRAIQYQPEADQARLLIEVQALPEVGPIDPDPRRAAERRIAPIIPLRKGRKAPLLTVAHSTDEWRSLYRRRSAVEREFGRLKHNFGLVLRTRGLRRAQLHADLVMLARLSSALSRTRSAAILPA